MEPEPPDIIQKTIGSRSQRRIDEKNFNSYTIKCGFEKSLKIDINYKEAFVNNINNRIEHISKGTHKLSILINIFIRECLEKTKNPLYVQIPNFLSEKDTTFARQLMIGSDDFERNNKPNHVILDFLERNEHIIKTEKFKRFQGDTNSITRACEAYLTNYRTYLKEIFKNKQIAFLYLWCSKNNLDFKYVKYIRYLINGWELTQKKIKNTYKLPKNIDKSIKDKIKKLIKIRKEKRDKKELKHSIFSKNLSILHKKLKNDGFNDMFCKILNFVVFQRKLLKLDNKNDKISDSWIKNNYETLIVYYSVLSKYFTKNGKKSILIAPLNKIKSMFLHIDTDVFYGILKNTGIPTQNKVTIIRNNKSQFFNEVFKIDKFLTENQKEKGFYFSGTVMTDGTALNIIFKRPKLNVTEEKELNRNDPNIRIIANDPGRSTLFCGIEILHDNTIKKYTLTRNHFHTVSGAKKAVKNSNKWNNLYLKEIIDQLSQTNSRSIKLHDFLKYMKIIKDNYRTLWDDALKKRHARQRFNLYSGKKKAYDKFFQSFHSQVDDRSIIIAYGDAGFASTSKYELSAPTTTLEKECRKWFKIVKVDEFRTTQLDYETGDILCKVIEKNKEKQQRTVRGLLWYRKTNEVCKFINRDINAAKNILKCYRLYPKRPKGMSTEDEKQEIPKAHYILNKKQLLSVIPKSIEGYEDLARFKNFFN
jgi:hypothetical protein